MRPRERIRSDPDGPLGRGRRRGEFSVANSQANPSNFSTRAFDDFATRAMKIRRGCDPEGPGLRGLITSNVVRSGRVQRGAVAIATISAPLQRPTRLAVKRLGLAVGEQLI